MTFLLRQNLWKTTTEPVDFNAQRLDGRRLGNDGIIGGESNRVPKEIRYKIGLAPNQKLPQIRKEINLLATLRHAITEFDNFNGNQGQTINSLQEQWDTLKSKIDELDQKRKAKEEQLNLLQAENSPKPSPSSSIGHTRTSAVLQPVDHPEAKRTRRNNT